MSEQDQQKSQSNEPKAATPTAPTPSPASVASQQTTQKPVESQTDAKSADGDIHEYREVADHVEARVMTEEERAQRQAATPQS